MDELTPEQALAVLQSLYKVVGAAVSTKDPYSLRGRLDAVMRDRYEATGMLDKIIIKDFDGRRIGTLSSTERDGKRERRVVVDDAANLLASTSADDWYDFIIDQCADEFAAWCVDNGIKSEGWHHEWVTTPAHWGGTRLTGCKPEEVLPALVPQLVSAMPMLLPEGVD